MAGITGSGVFILLSSFGLDKSQIFSLMIPTAIPYVLCFYWIHKMKRKYPFVEEKSRRMTMAYEDAMKESKVSLITEEMKDEIADEAKGN